MSAAARIGGGGHGRRGGPVGALLLPPPPVACPLFSVFFGPQVTLRSVHFLYLWY